MGGLPWEENPIVMYIKQYYDAKVVKIQLWRLGVDSK